MALRSATVPASDLWRETPSELALARGLRADLPTVAFFFIFWANIAVVATRYHGVPQVVASGVVLLLAHPPREVHGARAAAVRRHARVPARVRLFRGAPSVGRALEGPEPFCRPAHYLSGRGAASLPDRFECSAHHQDPDRVLWALILAGSFMGTFSIYQSDPQLWQRLRGPRPGRPLRHRRRFQRRSPGRGGEDPSTTAWWSFGSENRYAQILAAVLPLALIRTFRERRRRLRLAAAGCSLLITGGLLLSFSRGAAVAVAVTLAFMALLRELPLRHLLVTLVVVTGVVAWSSRTTSPACARSKA